MMTTTATDRFAGAREWLRANGPKALFEVAVNFALPFLIYAGARERLGDVHALMAASAPPLAWSIAEFALRRRVDALSLIVLAGILLSGIAFLGGGGVRFLQLREQLVTAVIGLVILGSAAIGRPLIYQLAKARVRRQSAAEAGSLETLRDHPAFRRAMMVMTLAWGVAMVAVSAACGALVFVLSIKTYLIVAPIFGYASLAAMTGWTFWYARRRIRPLRDAAAAPTR